MFKLAILLVFVFFSTALADVGLPNAKPLGSASFRWLGVTFYDATLYTQQASQFSWQKPMALELRYRKGVSGQKLAGSAAIEIKRLEGTPADYSQFVGKLQRCFRNVEKGDRYVALSSSPNTLQLSLNGRQTCTVNHPNARQRFFGIWLSPNSRMPGLSRRLRGE
ncbi:chalcone isomerase family protein [Epibacterium ulvae]|uniref:chalcone isomerase family protein n=1 Tax=Epibacterium ulvae TaxID=1156985 RepID=UPI001BFCC008|nr:chalcone isomerase family protein [Epibacterium ulvae]MBT8153167.1 chalcone isomerase family protein [Epibacterium ulvae]